MNEPNAEVRTPCSIPFCRRTIKGRWAFFICGVHWRLVDRDLKRLRTKLRQRYERRGEVRATDGGHYWTTPRAWRAVSGLQKRMIRQATDRSAGLA